MTERATVVADIVRDAVGEPATSVECVPTLEETDVFRVHLSSGVVYFKAEDQASLTAWAYGKAASVGVPVPEVLVVDTSDERWPEPFVIVTALEGSSLEQDLLEGGDLATALAAYGDLLRRLHEVLLEGFGALRGPEQGRPDPWGWAPDHPTWLRAVPEWGLPYLEEHGLVTGALVRRVIDVFARHEQVVPPPDHGVFVHGDPGLDHLFVDRKTMRITGLIDFEPASADPTWDLATFAYHYPHLIDRLLAGYGPTPDDLPLRLEVYGLARAIGVARWVHERASDARRELDEIANRATRLRSLLA